MKINSVTIEGMHNVTTPVTYQLEDFNYLIGHNGSGKSTALQAIQLAILGYIPGTAKTNKAIFEHANGPIMRVKVIFDDGKFIERTWAMKGKTINTDSNVPDGYDPKDVLGDLELPIFNFSEFLGLTANKAKDWFMNFLPGVESEINWNDQLSKAVEDMNLIDKDLISNTVEELSQIHGEDAIDTIRKANEALKADLSFAKGELQKAQATVQSLIYYDDVSSNDPDAEIAQIKKELEDIAQAESTLHSHQAAVDSNARINSLLQTLPQLVGETYKENPKYIELTDKKEQLLATLNSLTANPEDITPPDTSEIDEKIRINSEEYSKLGTTANANTKVIESGGICPYTSSACESVKKMIDQLSQENETLNARLQEISENDRKLRVERDQIISEFNQKESERKSKIRDVELEISGVEQQIRELQRDYDTRESYRSQLVGVPLIDGLKTFEEYQAMKDQLMDRSNKIAANKKYNELIESLTADKYRIENSIEAYKIWVKLTGENGLQTTLMEAPFTDFESDMNGFIHDCFGPNVDCKFYLSTEANSFSYGIYRNQHFIPYNLLSSGEKAMYTFALMRCIVSGYDSQLKLLVVDDVSDHLDATNLKATFESLYSTSDIQIVLAGVNTIDQLPCHIIEI